MEETHKVSSCEASVRGELEEQAGELTGMT